MTQDSSESNAPAPPPPGGSLAERRRLAVDALGALARGENASNDEPPAAPVEHADPSAEQAVGDVFPQAQTLPAGQDEPPDVSAEMQGISEAAAGPVRRARPRHRPLNPAWRYAIPPMAAMATMMFLISAWSLLVLAGVSIVGGVPSLATRRSAAWFLGFSLPVGLFMVVGCVIVWREVHRGRRS